MKFKILLLSALIASGASAEIRRSQESPTIIQPQTSVVTYAPSSGVRFAPVVRVEPVYHAESYSEIIYSCSISSVPVYRNTPIVENRTRDNSALTTLIGAVVGVAVAGSDMRAMGALAGGAIGYSMGSESTRNVVTGYNTEIVGYQDQQLCQQVNVPMQRMAVIGYSVNYDDNGVIKNIRMSTHPGSHIRLVTTTRIE
jgi:uncharacterized protein YcfJ